MGGAKHLLPIEGTPMLLRVVDALARSRVAKTLVVLGEGDEAGRAALVGRDCSAVSAEDAEEGRAASVRAGVRAAPADYALLFVLADQPWLEPADYDRLIEAAEGAGIVHASYDGQRGSPVLFVPHYRESLLALRGGQGGRTVIARHAEDCAAVPLDPSHGRDVDRPEDAR